MSKKEEQPKDQVNTKSTRNALAVVVAFIVVVTGVYVMRANDNANEALDNAANVQQTEEDESASYADWASYNWEEQGVSFRYPEGWLVGSGNSAYRLYVKNTDVDLMKEETPESFQQVWLTFDQDEASAAREEAIKNGVSAYRVVDGEVKASTIQAGGTTINVYEYNTLGGATLEAYWTGKDGQRMFATNSTEVGEPNQTEMVATLKKLLASIVQN